MGRRPGVVGLLFEQIPLVRKKPSPNPSDLRLPPVALNVLVRDKFTNLASTFGLSVTTLLCSKLPPRPFPAKGDK